MQITNQHTYLFPETGECVTAYVSDTNDGLAFALSFSHMETNTLKWTHHFEGILQIQSQVNPLIWYMYLTAYWDGGVSQIPTERVIMVKDCKAHNYK